MSLRLSALLLLIASAPKKWAKWSTRIAGVYALVVLTLILALSVLPINEFAPSVGMPSWGFALTLAGATGLLIAGMRPGAGR